MLLDPRNLGLGGFRTSASGGAGPALDLRELSPQVVADGAVLEKQVDLDPGFSRIHAEGPGAGQIELRLDGEPAVPDGPSRFLLPPSFAATAMLTIRFRGPVAPLTGLWLID